MKLLGIHFKIFNCPIVNFRPNLGSCQYLWFPVANCGRLPLSLKCCPLHPGLLSGPRIHSKPQWNTLRVIPDSHKLENSSCNIQISKFHRSHDSWESSIFDPIQGCDPSIHVGKNCEEDPQNHIFQIWYCDTVVHRTQNCEGDDEGGMKGKGGEGEAKRPLPSEKSPHFVFPILPNLITTTILKIFPCLGIVLTFCWWSTLTEQNKHLFKTFLGYWSVWHLQYRCQDQTNSRRA